MKTNTITLRPTTATNGTLAMEFYFGTKPNEDDKALKTFQAFKADKKANFSAKGTKGARWFAVGENIAPLVDSLKGTGYSLAFDKADQDAIAERLAGSSATVKAPAPAKSTKAKTQAKAADPKAQDVDLKSMTEEQLLALIKAAKAELASRI